jgi:hypothetical protein
MNFTLVATLLAALCVPFGCAARPPAPRIQPSAAPVGTTSGATETTALEREALVKGRRFHFRLSLVEQPNLVYHLDCLSGAAFCSEAIFRDFWTTQGLGAEDEAALATWKEVRSRYGGTLSRTRAALDVPLLMPMGTFDLAERQRIAGLIAKTPDAFRSAIGLVSTESDARDLTALLARFAPRFSRWWKDEAFARGVTFHEGFARLLADPFLEELLEKASRFYESELPPEAPFEFHLIVQPASTRRQTIAYQLDNHSAVEVSPFQKPEQMIEILAHEVSHYFFNYTAAAAKTAIAAKFTTSADPLSVAAFGVFDEVVACTIGNGIGGRHYRPDDFAAGLPKKGRLSGHPTASPISVALLSSMQAVFDRDVRISSDEFVETYLAAARTRWPTGSVPPIEHLRSHVFVGDTGFESAARKLVDASLAGFPSYRAYPQLDPSAKAFLVSHPFVNAAIFNTHERVTELLDTLRPEAKHRAALASLATRGRPFVYALPRTPKSYAFLFVAKTDAEMSDLVTRIAESKVTTAGAL